MPLERDMTENIEKQNDVMEELGTASATKVSFAKEDDVIELVDEPDKTSTTITFEGKDRPEEPLPGSEKNDDLVGRVDEDSDQQFMPQSRRKSHLESLIQTNRSSLAQFEPSAYAGSDIERDDGMDVVIDEGEVIPAAGEDEIESKRRFRELHRRLSVVYQPKVLERLVEVRVRDYSYYIPEKADAPSVKTVANQSICYAAYEFFRRMHQYRTDRREGTGASRRASLWRPTTASDVFLPYDKMAILSNINLVLKPGRAYLILGPPASGKTSLLKAIAGRLPTTRGMDGKPLKEKPHMDGRIEYNGVCSQDEPAMVLPNVVSYVGQLDIHAPYLTVTETFEYAFQSRMGGRRETDPGDQEEQQPAAACTENLTLEGLDLNVCADTFVGNSDVRGVSGGQRRRVTVGGTSSIAFNDSSNYVRALSYHSTRPFLSEMMQGQSPVACADEISTGLDAAVTFDIVHSIVAFAKAAKTTRVVSLLQPGPETFSLFDEVILLAKGYVIYAGPIDEVVDYFAGLGYKQMSTMDVADFLQLIPTPDGAMLFDTTSSSVDEHYTAEGFAQAFAKSEQYKRITVALDVPSVFHWKPKKRGRNVESGATAVTAVVPEEFMIKFQNSFLRTTALNLSRHLTLWKRDKSFIIGKLFENIGMAVATGGILFGSGRLPSEFSAIAGTGAQPTSEYSDSLTELSAGIYGALFMTTFHILLGKHSLTSSCVPTSLSLGILTTSFMFCGRHDDQRPR